MIKKLRSRGPIDIPSKFPIRPGLVAITFTFLAVALLAFLAGSVYLLLTGGKQTVEVLALGIGSGIVMMILLTWAGRRVDI
ncbi:MAG: hypothetical protein ACYDDF_13015 [Thermoplasmatota archaeon]